MQNNQHKETGMQNTGRNAPPDQAWIITGPTSGIGRRTALELAKHGTVVLVGRNPGRLGEVEAEIRKRAGGHAVPVVCDFSDITSVRPAAAQITSIYEKDTLTPSVPGTRLIIDPAEFTAFRPSYRCLAWRESRLGRPLRSDLLGDDRPGPVARQYEAEAAWLAGSA